MEDDPVVNEVLAVYLKHQLLWKCILLQANVFLSHALAQQLIILQVLRQHLSRVSLCWLTLYRCSTSQYPLRPAHMPYPIGDIAGARVRMQKREMELDISIQPRGENYSESRGEMYAKSGDSKGPEGEPYYRR